MRLQILSDLHLETETFAAQPAPGAELLILAGDIDRGWDGLRQFADWPVPVVFVAGNHEFDGRDVDQAATALRAFCDSLGLRMLHRDSAVIADDQGRRIRFCWRAMGIRVTPLSVSDPVTVLLDPNGHRYPLVPTRLPGSPSPSVAGADPIG